MTADVLYDSNFFNQQIDELKQNYFLIPKIKQKYMKIKPPTKPSEFFEALAYNSIIQIGEKSLRLQIADWYSKGEIGYSTKYRIEQMIDKKTSMAQIAEPHLMDELDSLMNEAVLEHKV